MKWKDNLTLPIKPDIWSHLDNFVVSEDGKSCSCSGSLLVIDGGNFLKKMAGINSGILSNGWSVAVGDPIGKYKYSLDVNGTKYDKEFSFIPFDK